MRTRALMAPLPALILSIGVARAAHAQQGGLVLEAPASTEAMAWGNAPNLFSRASDLLFYAPALIGRTEGFAAGLQRYGSEGTLASLSGTGSVGLGNFAVGVQYLQYETDALAAGQDLQSGALTPGDLGVTEFVGSLGYAREIFGIDAGVVIKYLEQDFGRIEDGTVAFDFGLATEVGPTMVSLTARNLGSDLMLSTVPCVECLIPTPASVEVEIPTQLAVGLSTEEFEVGEFDMFVTSQVMRRRDGEVIPAGGLEISYWPVAGYTFRLRAGLQRVVEDARSPLTLGAAFTGDGLTIEYAFQSFDGEGNAHRFGLSWR